MNINKSLLFSSLLALSLLNTAACIAMDAAPADFDFNTVDPDNPKAEDIRAALDAAKANDVHRKKLAAELEQTQKTADEKAAALRKQLKEEYAGREQEINAAVKRAEAKRQEEEAAKEKQRQEAEENYLKKQRKLQEALEKEQARPFIQAEYGSAPATDKDLSNAMAANQLAQAANYTAQTAKINQEKDSIRNNDYYIVATDYGKPVIEKLILPIVHAELQPYVTEKRQEWIGKTAVEKRNDRINELNEEIGQLNRDLKKRNLRVSEVNEEHSNKVNRIDRLARLFENTMRYCNETNDKEGCRQLKDQFYVLQKKHMDEFYKEELGKDYVPATTPASPVK